MFRFSNRIVPCFGFATALFLVGVLTPPLRGQAAPQTIHGQVTDATGAVIPGATVALTDLATGATQTARTEANGGYSFSQIPIGNYSVICRLAGFKSAMVSNQHVGAGDRLRINFDLQIGDENETVEVPDASADTSVDDASDRCFVWALDVNQARKVLLERGRFAAGLSELSKEEMTALATTFQQQFDEFYPTFGEEELTNKYYPFPYGDGTIVATVYYTDESMAGNISPNERVVLPSMFLCIAVGERSLDNACEAPGGAVAEVAYVGAAMKTRVKTRLAVSGRPIVVGMECERPKSIEALGNETSSDR